MENIATSQSEKERVSTPENNDKPITEKVISESDYNDKSTILAEDKRINMAVKVNSVLNGKQVRLLYSESLLLGRECLITISDLAVTPPPLVITWTFHIIFTDDFIATKARTSEMVVGNNNITITYYGWYMSSWMEDSMPHYVESVSKNVKLFIKVRTIATKDMDTRSIQINIWKIIQ